MKELYQSYLAWCENSGVDALSNARFGKELTRRGYESIKGREGNSRRGIALVSDLDPTSPEFYSRIFNKSDSGIRPN